VDNVRLWKTLRVLLACAALTVTSSACGGGSAGTSGEGSVDDAYVSHVQDEVDKYLSETGSYVEPPSTGPAPVAGKRIALVSCGEAFPTCAQEMAGAQRAIELIGWEATLFDSKGDMSVAGSAVRSAVASKYDGIFTYYIDCEYIKAPLEEAKAAGIPVVGGDSQDCGSGDQSLYANGGGVLYNTFDGQATFTEWVKDWIHAQALYPIAKKAGKANILHFSETTGASARAEDEEVEATVEECASCTFTRFSFPTADYGTKLQGEAEQQLLRNPDVNAVLPNYETILVSGVSGAIKASGRDLLVSAGEGTAASAELRSSGLAQYGAGFAYDWEAFAAIDDLNRVFNGEKPVNSGIGVQLFDKDHNWPAATGFVPPIDFKSAYKKTWGVS
jgi:ribose transport system substrate-binding protein